jgi:ferrous iron transport protein B
VSACHDGAAPGVDTLPERTSAAGRTPTVALVGNPNVGKSTLFNALTGARQRVVNAPGTTVELQLGTWRTPLGGDRDGRVRVVDLPGTYSLLARSPDERVTADAVAGAGPLGAPDLAVVLVEAAALSRSLYLLAQVALAGSPTVVALTMTDVAASRGIHVEPGRLAELLGVPVVAVDPRDGRGTDALARAVDAALDDPPHVALPGVPARRAPAAPSAHAEAVVEPVVEAVVEPVAEPVVEPVAGPNPTAGPAEPGADARAAADELAVADALFTWVDATVRAVGTAPARRTRSDRVDRLLLHPWFGIPVFLLVMWGMFELATTVATPLIDGVDHLVNGTVADQLRTVLPGPHWLDGLLVDGVLAGVGTVLSFVPLMALVFLAMAVLEDSGYLARAAFVADRAMRAIGLDGRAMLPLVVGFGCNLPALAATRTLPNARSRLLTGLLVPYTSCPARLTVYVLLAGVFFPDRAGTVIFALYLASVLLVVVGGLVLRRTLFRDLRREPLVLALPAYQRPRVRPLLLSAWTRSGSFVTKAGTIIVTTLAAVWLLMAVPVAGAHPVGDVPVEDSLYGRVAEGVAPVFAPAGFDDWHLSAALATGFVAKEVVVGSFAQSYAVDEPADPSHAGGLGDGLRTTFDETSGGHAGAAALAFLVFVLAYTPCLATVSEQRRLFGGRWAAGSVGVQLVVAWVLAVAVFQVGRLL